MSIFEFYQIVHILEPGQFPNVTAELTSRSFIKISRLYDQVNSVKDLADAPMGKCPNLFPQVSLVDSECLRYIHYALLWQACLPFVQQHIARGFRSPQVGRERTHDYGVDPAAVEHIVLDYDMGMAIARLGASRITQVNPKHITLVDHHCPSTNCLCCRRIPSCKASSSGSGAPA